MKTSSNTLNKYQAKQISNIKQHLNKQFLSIKQNLRNKTGIKYSYTQTSSCSLDIASCYFENLFCLSFSFQKNLFLSVVSLRKKGRWLNITPKICCITTVGGYNILGCLVPLCKLWIRNEASFVGTPLELENIFV